MIYEKSIKITQKNNFDLENIHWLLANSFVEICVWFILQFSNSSIFHYCCVKIDEHHLFLITFWNSSKCFWILAVSLPNLCFVNGICNIYWEWCEENSTMYQIKFEWVPSKIFTRNQNLNRNYQAMMKLLFYIAYTFWLKQLHTNVVSREILIVLNIFLMILYFHDYTIYESSHIKFGL